MILRNFPAAGIRATIAVNKVLARLAHDRETRGIG